MLPNFLELWRTLTPEELLGNKSLQAGLRAFLGSRFEPRNDGERHLINVAVSGAGKEATRAALAIAVGRTGPVEDGADDFKYSWVLLAALDQFEPAMAVLAQTLVLRAGGPLFRLIEPSEAERVEARRFMRLARRWAMQVTTPFLRNLGEWGAVREALIESGKQAVASTAAKESPPNTLQVIAQIGHPETEDFSVGFAYAPLAEPLALNESALRSEILRSLLNAEFPHFSEAVDRICDDLALRERSGIAGIRFRPILLEGPPGIGKTRFARRLAELTGTGHAAISVAGVTDNRLLEGTARGWKTAQVAWPLLVMMRTKCANPILLVDEIDKAGASASGGDVRQTLLGMIENETARAWYDACLLTNADLSQVSWILTANETRRLSQPLLSRLRVVSVEPPGMEAFDGILSGIKQDVASDLGVTVFDLPSLDEAIESRLRLGFQKIRDVRVLKRAVERVLSVAAREPRLLN